jgi:hypothetical protein
LFSLETVSNSIVIAHQTQNEEQLGTGISFLRHSSLYSLPQIIHLSAAMKQVCGSSKLDIDEIQTGKAQGKFFHCFRFDVCGEARVYRFIF